MTYCKICGDDSEDSIFEIKFKMVHVCNECADTIFLQQARWLIDSKKKK